MLTIRIAIAATAALFPLAPLSAQGPEAPPVEERKSMEAQLLEPEEAWWTGPLLANTPNVPSPGHLAVETYFFDVLTQSNSHIGSITFAVLGVIRISRWASYQAFH